MMSGMVLRYSFDDPVPQLAPLAGFVKADVIISDYYSGDTYAISLKFNMSSAKTSVVVAVVGHIDRPFATYKSEVTAYLGHNQVKVKCPNCAADLIALLGDKSARETDVVGILSDRLNLAKLRRYTLDEVADELDSVIAP